MDVFLLMEIYKWMIVFVIYVYILFICPFFLNILQPLLFMGAMIF